MSDKDLILLIVFRSAAWRASSWFKTWSWQPRQPSSPSSKWAVRCQLWTFTQIKKDIVSIWGTTLIRRGNPGPYTILQLWLILLLFRMFVKVSVGYGEGKKSAPLDLLLYDSQCWHCSLTGECNAKPNNKCVFSAATSSVQTFRIGKSISNGDGGIVLRFDPFFWILLILLQKTSTFVRCHTTRAAVKEKSSDIFTTRWRQVVFLTLNVVAINNLFPICSDCTCTLCEQIKIISDLQPIWF